MLPCRSLHPSPLPQTTAWGSDSVSTLVAWLPGVGRPVMHLHPNCTHVYHQADCGAGSTCIMAAGEVCECRGHYYGYHM